MYLKDAKLYVWVGSELSHSRDLLSTCIFKNQELPSLLWSLCFSFVLDQEQCDKNNIEQLEIMDYQGKKSSLLITLRTLNFSHLSIFPFCRGCRTIILQLMILLQHSNWFSNFGIFKQTIGWKSLKSPMDFWVILLRSFFSGQIVYKMFRIWCFFKVFTL